jgi:cell division protein FtsQ
VTPPIDPRIRQRRAAVRRSAGRRRLRIVIGAVVVIGAVAGGAALLHTSLFSARVVVVSGEHPRTPTQQILDVAGLARHPPLVDVVPSTVQARVGTLPFIGQVTVTRGWPDGVRIVVTERHPIAAMAGPGSGWSVLDATGRTLQVQPTSPLGLAVLVVDGAKGPLAPSPVGGSLGSVGVEGLHVCRTLPLAFSAQVTSVIVAPDASISLTLDSGLTVLLGTDSDLTAKFEDVASIIAHASLRGKKIIDVTVPISPVVGPS